MLTGQILLQMIIILIVVQCMGFLCQRIGQQWVIGEIVAGLVLGPSLFGALWPNLSGKIFPPNTLPSLQTFGDIGLVLYMFALGARLDTHLMLGQSRKAILTSLSGILLPLGMGSLLAFFLFPGLAGTNASQFSFMLMIGTAMAITAFPVLARLLTEKGMVNTRLGTLALTCAAIDDVVAWCLLAFVTAIIHATSAFAVIGILGTIVLFTLIMFLVVRPVLIFADRHITYQQLLIAMIMVLVLSSAYFTNSIGVHPLFGAFLAGVILPRRARFVAYIRSLDRINATLFLPLFFVYSGLRTQLGLLNTPALWLLCVIIFVVACAGKIGGGTLCTRVLGDTWKDAFSLGILMNTRGLVELIVLNIGLDLKVLSPTIFTLLVIMALFTTMMASPLLSLLGYRYASRAPHDDEELDEARNEQNTSQAGS